MNAPGGERKPQKLGQSIDELIVSPDTYADPDVYAYVFARLRREDPVHWTEAHSYRPFWTISKLEDIREIERLNETFINNPRTNLRPIVEEEKVRRITGGRTEMFEGVVQMDGARHRAHRAIAQTWFSPSNVRRLESAIFQNASEYVERLVRCGGEADFCEVVAGPFPLRVIMTIFGVGPEHEALLMTYARMISSPLDADIDTAGSGLDSEARIRGAQGLFEFYRDIMEERRRHPTDDLLSIIANAQIDSAPIGELAALTYCVIMSTAGHDTTSYTASGGLLALLENPAQMDKLRQDQDLLPLAVDEMVRWVTPVKSFMRTATVDYTIRDKVIREGQALLLAFLSGNRDEETFESPWEFRVDRRPNAHLGFGFGVHTCMGMHLAKLELRGLFTAMLRRTKSIELADTPRYYRATTVQGLKSLPIRYSLH